MSELNINDFELSIKDGKAEYRPAIKGEFFLYNNDGVIDGPSIAGYYIMRRKPEPVHNGFWAMAQMLDGKRVAVPDASSGSYFLYNGSDFLWTNGVVTHRMSMGKYQLTRTDWQLYDETPIADAVRTKLRAWCVVDSIVDCVCENIASLERRIAELENK